jgi:diguanylate cyclase (GGDEF)-like protein/PAS domain S-box-containing protein
MKRFPISLRISIPTILVICGSVLGIVSFNQEINEAYQRTELNTKNYVQISAGQTSRVLDYLYRRTNIEDAEITIISQLGSDPNLDVVMLIDEKNVVRISSRYELRNSPISETIAANYDNYFANARNKLAGNIFISDDRKKLIATYPVFLPNMSQELQSSRVGILFMSYDLERNKQLAFNDALKRSLIFNGSLILFCLLIWFFFEISFTRRVSSLVAASNSLAEGDLNTRSGLSGSDELFQVSVAFDRMANKIQEDAIQQVENAIQQLHLFEQLQKELTEREKSEARLTETNQKLAISNLEREKEADARKILLEELQESEARYRSVITSMSEGIILQQVDGQIIACNESAEKILGLSADQMQGLKSIDFDRATIREDGSIFSAEEHPTMVTLRTGQPQTNVIMGICQKDLPIKWISINSQPLFHSNQTTPYAAVASFTDITQQRLAQEMLKHQAEQNHLRAITDGLTQVANRRCFDERLQFEWQRSLREQQSLSLILIDIDYFKLYNDHYGHQAGDHCLIEVAQTAEKQIKRPADLFARYGGEEFVVILPNTDMIGAIAVAELIQQSIRDLKISHTVSKISPNVTISLGIASLTPSDDISPEAIIAIADENLYQAKQRGRDRLYWGAS